MAWPTIQLWGSVYNRALGHHQARVCMPLAAGRATGGDDAMWEDADTDTAPVHDTSNAGRWLAASAAKPVMAPASSMPSMRSSALDALNTPHVQFTPGPAGGRSTGSKYRKTPGLKVCTRSPMPAHQRARHAAHVSSMQGPMQPPCHDGDSALHARCPALPPLSMAGAQPGCSRSVPAAGAHASLERQR